MATNDPTIVYRYVLDTTSAPTYVHALIIFYASEERDDGSLFINEVGRIRLQTHEAQPVDVEDGDLAAIRPTPTDEDTSFVRWYGDRFECVQQKFYFDTAVDAFRSILQTLDYFIAKENLEQHKDRLLVYRLALRRTQYRQLHAPKVGTAYKHLPKPVGDSSVEFDKLYMPSADRTTMRRR